MTTLSLLDVVSLSISTAISTALVMIVLGTGPKRALNRSFALFALMIAISAITKLLFYLCIWLKVGDTLLLAELSYLPQIAMGFLLLLFTTHYLDRRTKWTGLAVGLGLVTTVILSVPLFQGRLITDAGLEPRNNLFDVEMSTGGSVGIQISAVCIFWSVILFWQERRRTGEVYLALSMLILASGYVLEGALRMKMLFYPISSFTTSIAITFLGHGIIGQQMFNPLQKLTQELEHRVQERTRELEAAYAEMEQRVEERTAELQREIGERERLQREIIEAQQLAIHELSTPIIPVMDTPQGSIIVAPLIGSIDSQRAKDITRALLAGIRQHQATVVILDITGVSIVDSGVANHLNKTIQAARLKGTHTIVTGISEAVAETIVELGIDWDKIDTLSDLQSGLAAALNSLGMALTPLELE
jgi:anti-anti-sigma regulatory factor